MTDTEILTNCKIMLFGTSNGNFRDMLLMTYINEVKQFMLGAGVHPNVINSEKSVGVIALGVNDLWNYKAGGVKLSQYVTQRVIQLARDTGEIKPIIDKAFKQFTWYTKTTAATTQTVVFIIPEYDPTTDDAVNVFVNGMLCVLGVDYTLTGSQITFEIPKVKDTEINVIVNKLVNVEV